MHWLACFYDVRLKGEQKMPLNFEKAKTATKYIVVAGIIIASYFVMIKIMH